MAENLEFIVLCVKIFTSNMENTNLSVLKGLMAVLTISLSNEHLLGVDQTNKMLLIGIITVLTLIFPTEQVIDTVKEIADGNHPVAISENTGLTNEIMQIIQPIQQRTQIQPSVTPLTPKETEVLTLMADGLMNKEIAHRMGLREGTVKCHVTSIFHKLNASVRTEAVILAIQNNLITVNTSGKA